MTARVIVAGHNEWHVFDDDDDGDYLDYLGLIKQVGDTFRAHGARTGVDNHVVSMEAEFRTHAEAKAWLEEEPEEVES
jgi:hypothetical protein